MLATVMLEQDIKAQSVSTMTTEIFNSIRSNDPLLLNGRAFVNLLNGESAHALVQFESILSSDQDNLIAEIGVVYSFMAKKMYKEALNTLIKIFKCGAPVRLLLGICLYEYGKYSEAEHFLATCSEPIASLYLCYIYSHTGREKQALQGFHKIYKQDPTNAHALCFLSNYFFHKNEFNKAASLASKAAKHADDYLLGVASYYEGRVHHSQNHFEEAKHFYTTAYSLRPDLHCNTFALAQIHVFNNNLDEGIKLLQAILESTQKAKDNVLYETRKLLAMCLAKRSRFPESKKLLKQILVSFPDDVEVWIQLATVSTYEESKEAYDHVVRLLGDSVLDLPSEVINNIAVLTENADILQSSLSVLGSSPRLKAMSVTMRYNLALLNESIDVQESIKLYSDILKCHPNYIECSLRLGILKIANKEFDEADELFDKVLTQYPQHKDTFKLKAYSLFVKKDITAARKSFEKILQKLDKHDIYSLLALGTIYLVIAKHEKTSAQKSANHKRALEFFNKVLMLNPYNKVAANGVAVVLAQKKMYPHAKELFLRVKQVYDSIEVNLGHVYCELGQYVAALKMYESTKDHLLIAKALFYLGRSEASSELLLKAKDNLLMCSKDDHVIYNIGMCDLELAKISLAQNGTNSRELLSEALSNFEKSISLGSFVTERIKQVQSMQDDALSVAEIEKRRLAQKTEKIAKLRQLREEQRQKELEAQSALESEKQKQEEEIARKRQELLQVVRQVDERMKSHLEVDPKEEKEREKREKKEKRQVEKKLKQERKEKEKSERDAKRKISDQRKSRKQFKSLEEVEEKDFEEVNEHTKESDQNKEERNEEQNEEENEGEKEKKQNLRPQSQREFPASQLSVDQMDQVLDDLRSD